MTVTERETTNEGATVVGLFSLFGGRRIADLGGQVSAIGKSQAVIELDLDGTVRHANDSFLKAIGYEQHSVSRVAEGSRLVDESDKTLGEIVATVRKVTAIVAELAAASRVA